MHDKYSEKPLLISDQLFHSIEFFRQRLNEIDEVCFGFIDDSREEAFLCRFVNV